MSSLTCTEDGAQGLTGQRAVSFLKNTMKGAVPMKFFI